MCNIIKFPGKSGVPLLPVVKMPVAFRIGALAHEIGLPFLSNPFAPGTIRHAEWADGWVADSMGKDNGNPS